MNQFPHPHTTLPGHDPSKVRTADDCITASASEALDVRVLKVAEWLTHSADVLKAGRFFNMADEATRKGTDLIIIAAEIRDAAAPRRPVERNEIIATRNATTITELRDVWMGAPVLRAEMEPDDRIRFLECVVGRLLVIEARHEGDGK